MEKQKELLEEAVRTLKYKFEYFEAHQIEISSTHIVQYLKLSLHWTNGQARKYFWRLRHVYILNYLILSISPTESYKVISI